MKSSLCTLLLTALVLTFGLGFGLGCFPEPTGSTQQQQQILALTLGKEDAQARYKTEHNKVELSGFAVVAQALQGKG